MWSRQGDLFSKIQERKRTNGKIPNETCPIIDELLSFQEYVPENERKQFIDSLEELRRDNAKLRELGVDWYKFCNELSDDADEIIEDIEKERDEYEREIENLKEKVEELEESLVSANS